MACRVARLSHMKTGIDFIQCCKCGSGNLEVFHTSKTLGPHLCSICGQSAVEYLADQGQQETIAEGRPCVV